MNRRAFIEVFAGGLVIARSVAEAQPAGKVYCIGVLEPTSMALNAANLDAFRQGLREFGYVEGRNMRIEYRSADGKGCGSDCTVSLQVVCGFAAERT